MSKQKKQVTLQKRIPKAKQTYADKALREQRKRFGLPKIKRG